jgi:hypothetical protein
VWIVRVRGSTVLAGPSDCAPLGTASVPADALGIAERPLSTVRAVRANLSFFLPRWNSG